MSQLVTRCPHCSTSFHVNEQQLRAARGAVRCGSCLQVFRADENIVFAEGDPDANRDLEALLEDDDFLIHDDIDLEDDEPAAATAPSAANRPDTTAGTDDEPLIGEAFGDSQWQDVAASESEEFDDPEDDSPALKPDWDDDPWADEIPEPRQKREPVFSADWDDDAPADEFSEQLENIQGHASKAPAGEKEPPPTSPERELLISAIEPVPLEVAWRPQRNRHLPGWLWTLLALLLAVALAAQVAYFRFDSLSKQQPWRDLYAKACPLLDCKLPPLEDLQAIHTSNLIVRSHPQLAGALVVDAVLLNTAPYAQPFPSLLLSFSDLKNQPVASRLFAPRDYLQGELAGRRQMPSGSPVHIAIEIVDPGSAAVNYELHIAH
ncbi:MJ0042 family finger-like domain-containing protein [Microbulbifer donghaiensis]|uniref:MJ0042 family finger-like domain-containing protein n=1 Tax=Microbulbifer donghaiensis TaxID=494016 RepID=A0A1M5DQF7_9GAMM|nr:DUF3426 domain-containing protein [Microbulbifer donghaiensis]SHF69203.1 MJ0042 family finger-like domain-containing protein [Microbulbifer donghaiensis]